ncbi:MAG TPA: two-component regulator propeller domain-containing protein, partial [Lacibacter sp.]|nr:two-component regulator propeller domain-containing protein [Lacibacter sp.]
MPRVLYCIASLIILKGCVNRSTQPPGSVPLLYAAPVTVAIDTVKGYKINLHTGSSVNILQQQNGTAVQTGISFLPTITPLVTGRDITVATLRAGKGLSTAIQQNSFSVPITKKPQLLSTANMRHIPLRKTVDSNSATANTITSGKSYPLTGKKVKAKLVKPLPALPMRTKDNATVNVQFLDVAQGLSASYIYAVLQDSKGNLWFGTDGMGITKYDGVHFYHYTEKEGLAGKVVTSVIEDKQGNIWIATYTGISKFDGTYFTNFTPEQGLTNNWILHICEDKKGNLWFSSVGGGVVVYNGSTITTYGKKEGLPTDTIHKVIQDKNGMMWIATLHGAVSFDGSAFTTYRNTNFSDVSIYSIIEDKTGAIWFATKKGLVKLDKHFIYTYTESDGLAQTHLWDVTTDSTGNLWMSTVTKGLTKFDGRSFTNYGVEQGFANTKLRQVITDRNGCVWAGSDGGGVIKFNPSGFSYPLPEKLLGNSRVRPLLKDKDNQLWMGLEIGQLARFTDNGNNAKSSLTVFDTKDNLKYSPRSLLQIGETLWLCNTNGAGLVSYNGNTITQYKIGTNPQDNVFFDLKEDNSGKLFFGTNSGRIGSFYKSAFEWITTPEELPAKIVYSVFKDSRHNLWFATEGAGLCKYNGTSFTIYTEQEGLPSNSITSIAEDKWGNLWLGTLGAGVCMFNGKAFISYRKEQGLSNDMVWSVFTDSTGNIWAGTDKGLNLFTASANNNSLYMIYSFDEQDGLKAADFNLHGVSADGQNRIWWSTGKSLITLPAGIK